MPNDTTAAPIVVQPSQHWEGNDGPWSTFDIHVGTPSQPTRVLISTASGETWVISANKTQGGCIGNDPPSCPQSRGALVNVNQSSTWQDQGLFAVGIETNLPDYDNEFDVADYGLETVGLGLPGANGASEPNLIVGALATKDFYLGYLGVTNQPTNFTEFDNPHPSFLSTLKAQQKLPSLSYAYSAGAQYRFRKVQGTLTLGGYDTSRLIPNDIDFKFAPDISRDLVVGLQSITFSDSKTTDRRLLSEGILTFIDSTVPHIWLPQDACTLFEDAFGITYNDTVDRYLVNDTLHEKLQSQNASVTFVLGNNINGGTTVNITLPYAAFDLQAFDLQVNGSTVNGTENYFPLRRAANETQYTLGRTFLQEAYLIVNYERSNFSVSQAAWVDNAPEHIVAIKSINDTTTPATKTPQNSSGISIGAIVGIIVAAVVILILAAVSAFFIIRRRRKRRKEAEKKEEDDDPYRKPEMDGTGKPPMGELYTEGKLGEVDSSSKVEMQGSQPEISAQGKKHMAEIEGSRGGAEMEGTAGGMEMEGSHLRAEMAGDHLAPVELDAGPLGLHELSTPNTSNSELPSPFSATNERKSGLSATWIRRQKPTPRLPDSESSDISADAEGPRRSGIGAWTGRKSRSLAPKDVSSTSSSSRGSHPSQPSPNPIPAPSPNSRDRRPSGPSSRYTGLEVPSRGTTPVDISSQSSGSRERRLNRGNAVERRMDSASNTVSPLGALNSREQSLRREDGAEDWNRGFGSRERNSNPRSPEIWSPVSPGDRSPDSEGWEMADRMTLSPLGNEPRRASPRTGTPRTNPSVHGTPREGSPLPPGNFF